MGREGVEGEPRSANTFEVSEALLERAGREDRSLTNEHDVHRQVLFSPDEPHPRGLITPNRYFEEGFKIALWAVLPFAVVSIFGVGAYLYFAAHLSLMYSFAPPVIGLAVLAAFVKFVLHPLARWAGGAGAMRESFRAGTFRRDC